MKPFKVLTTALLLLTFSLSYAQKSTMEKANQLYKLDSYADAIPLFQKSLSNRESLPGRTKLAYSLMMLNRMEEAEIEYRKVIEEPRLRSDAYFQFGQVLMSLEKYAEAKTYFLKFNELEPDKIEGQLMATACDKVQFIEPVFQYVNVEEYAYNTDLDDTAPVYYNNGIVFSSDRNPGIKFLKQKSATTGRDYVRLYYSKMEEAGTYKSPKSFSAKINELNKNVATASFSADGAEVYFTKNGSTVNRRNAYAMQLYSSKKGNLKWKGSRLLSFCRPNYNYMHPCISTDGKTLFFTSDKPSGEGGTDIYYSIRKKGKWGKARNMGPNVNTLLNEGFPFMHSDGKLYFCSKGHVGFGGYDIFVTEKNANGEWKEPINVGKPFNSSHDDVALYLKSDSTSGFFTSSREGGDDDIYLFEISDQPFPIEEKEVAVFADSLPDVPKEVYSIIAEEEEAELLNELAVEPVAKEEEVITEIPTEIPIEIQSEAPIEIATEVPTEVTTEIQSEAPIEIATEVPTEVTTEIQSEAPIEIATEVPDEMVTEIAAEDTVRTEMIPQKTLKTDSKILDSKSKLQNKKEILREKSGLANVIIKNENKSNLKPIEQEQLVSFDVIKKSVKKGSLEKGMYCVLEAIEYLPGEYLLNPSKTKYLKPIAELMRKNPSLKLEIAAHTVSIGYDENNLEISKKRAKAIFNYMLYKDVPAERMTYVGLGETNLLNHCENGVVCSEEEHLENQRVEFRVVN